jgi:DNA-binding response OmpR family regulator
LYFLSQNERGNSEEILRAIWGREENADNRVLETVVYNLKQKLKKLAINKQLIIIENNYYRIENEN